MAGKTLVIQIPCFNEGDTLGITLAALPRSGMAASRSPATISQNVPQASDRLQRGRSKARAATRGTNPQMKNVVKTSTFRTPCSVSPW